MSESSALFKRRCCVECGTVTDSSDVTVVRGNLTLDRALRRVQWNGQQVALTPQAVDILELLVQREGRIVQDWAFYIRVLDEDSESNLLEVQVCKLRKAFRAVDPDFRQLETVRGQGFRWRRASETVLS